MYLFKLFQPRFTIMKDSCFIFSSLDLVWFGMAMSMSIIIFKKKSMILNLNGIQLSIVLAFGVNPSPDQSHLRKIRNPIYGLRTDIPNSLTVFSMQTSLIFISLLLCRCVNVIAVLIAFSSRLSFHFLS